MPERPLKIATYAASASFVAILLGYIFGPTLFPTDHTNNDKKNKGVVGLSNPANDCFINSILQAFAGLGAFKEYLVLECELSASGHGQHLGEDEESTDSSFDPMSISTSTDGVAGEKKSKEKEKQEKRVTTPPQQGQQVSRALKDEAVTRSLKAKLDELGETTAFRKTISAGDFVRTLEFAFGAHISRQQQDAQEFLHVVAERLCDEFHACRHGDGDGDGDGSTIEKEKLKVNASEDLRTDENQGEPQKIKHLPISQPQAFPLEGTMESQIECLECNFKPKPNVSSFVTLTLNVPQRTSTTLDACLDGLLKTEFIDGYKCDRCRIQHALGLKTRQLARVQAKAADSNSNSHKDSNKEANSISASLEHEITLLNRALLDPENPPPTNPLSLPSTSPEHRSRIAKHTRISTYPPTLALHLSRSIYSRSTASMKNSARVEFPETLVLGGLGGLLHRERDRRGNGNGNGRKTYSLQCVVTHRGGHNSGHYETYRRQGLAGLNSGLSYTSSLSVDLLQLNQEPPAAAAAAAAAITPVLTPTDDALDGAVPADITAGVNPVEISGTGQSHDVPHRGRSRNSTSTHRGKDSDRDRGKAKDREKEKEKEKEQERRRSKWWCISDDKVRACNTADVLGLQKEAYLLFYELLGSGNREGESVQEGGGGQGGEGKEEGESGPGGE